MTAVEIGHYQYECQENYADLEDVEEMVLMAYVDRLGGDQHVVWYIDYGCSNHMCGDSSLFCELEEGFNKGLKTLQTKGMVRGLPSFSEGEIVCTNCLKGKQHHDVISRRSTWRASEKLELVHTDIYGPISPFSEGNKRYFICFIDDYSRNAWVYFLAYKSDAFTTFKLFKALVEKETGLSIKCLRTDRGGEFTSNEFKEYCKMNGIKRQLPAAYTPQQNGVAERKNRSVMNMVRSLLVEKNVPRKFWAEAVNWAFYVLNRCPTSSMKERHQWKLGVG